jgi:hypothetical protein
MSIEISSAVLGFRIFKTYYFYLRILATFLTPGFEDVGWEVGVAGAEAYDIKLRSWHVNRDLFRCFGLLDF